MINKEIERIFVEELYLDEQFPKGDKRRGEVLCLIGILNAKIQKAIAEKDKKFKEFIRLLKEKGVSLRKGERKVVFVDEIEELSNLNEDFPVTAGDIGNGEID